MSENQKEKKVNESEVEENATEEMDDTILSKRFKTLNNKGRFAILSVLKKHEIDNRGSPSPRDPYYSMEIRDRLYKDFDIDLSVQRVGQHLHELEKWGFVEKEESYVEKKFKVQPVNRYVLKKDAFEDIFLELNFLCDDIKSFVDLFDDSQAEIEEGYCLLKIFNGANKGETFMIGEDETIIIGRQSDNQSDLEGFSIVLDDSYTTVSRIDKPHLKIFNRKGTWYLLDDSSTNGTYVSDVLVKKGEKTQLKNDRYIRLSKGPGSAIMKFRYKR